MYSDICRYHIWFMHLHGSKRCRINSINKFQSHQMLRSLLNFAYLIMKFKNICTYGISIGKKISIQCLNINIQMHCNKFCMHLSNQKCIFMTFPLPTLLRKYKKENKIIIIIIFASTFGQANPYLDLCFKAKIK